MARRIKFTPKQTPRGSWCLNIPAKHSESGQRERHFFKTRDLAKAAAEKLKAEAAEFGAQAKAVAPALAEQAVAASKLLEPWNMTLLEAVGIAVELRKRESVSVPVGAGIDAWLASCEGLRPKTIGNYKVTATRLRSALGDKLLANVTAEDLQSVLAPVGRSGAGVLEQIRNGKAWWRYCAGKGWCEVEIFAKLEVPKTNREQDEISVLTPDQARQLLEVAAREYPEAVASFAIALFAGVRAEELSKLEAENVSAGGIELSAEITKRGRRRHIALSDTLAAWLKAYPFERCPSWRETSAAVRRLCGWDVSARLVADRKLEPPALGRWPQNVLRHTFASYAIANGTPLESMLFEFGHTGTPALLRAHYAGRASKKAALEFFSILPPGAPAIQTLKVV